VSKGRTIERRAIRDYDDPDYELEAQACRGTIRFTASTAIPESKIQLDVDVEDVAVWLKHLQKFVHVSRRLQREHRAVWPTDQDVTR
jgi:hypothetical protein